jgi:hypothetical protein
MSSSSVYLVLKGILPPPLLRLQRLSTLIIRKGLFSTGSFDRGIMVDLEGTNWREKQRKTVIYVHKNVGLCSKAVKHTNSFVEEDTDPAG